MKSFWLELKSICKSFKFIALILILIAYQAMLLAQFHGEAVKAQGQEIRSNDRNLSENTSWVAYWERRHNYFLEHGQLMTPVYSIETIEYDLGWYQYEQKLAHDLSSAYLERDWSTYNRSMADRRLLEWNLLEITTPGIIPPEEYFGEKWNLFSTLAHRPHFQQRPYHFARRLTMTPNTQHVYLSAAYYLHLLAEDLPPARLYDTSPWGFTFNFMRRGLPNILGIIVLLMTATIIHRDRKSGAIKSALQRPKGRARYLLRKLSQGFIASAAILLTSQFLVFLVQGLQHGFRGLAYPVLMDKYFLRWFPMSEHVTYALGSHTRFSQFGLSLYQLPWNAGYPITERIDIIPLGQFMGLALVCLAVFIFFCAVVGIVISVVIKNEVAAQIIAIGIFALGTSLGRIVPKLNTTPWDLFSKVNVIPLLEGSHFSTYLSSLTALVVAIIVLFGIGTLAFSRQDIQ